ncbi:hypothetical protein ACYCFK_20745 [Stutzerimonas stutzeri]
MIDFKRYPERGDETDKGFSELFLCLPEPQQPLHQAPFDEERLKLNDKHMTGAFSSSFPAFSYCSALQIR